ncbi:HAMP domain-containing sensor histidine kinase [Rummeliibacillus pycnus]|uniref:HAMP domain-containing sensor histidine kinase n=1 Tax=Rummeliibacillus pycnus TaxID=101070 RepID=UPI002ADD7298|nr:HAMP domain-containing sensor histidine kinase [Rummeliibacillus pycnus]
MNTYYHQVTKAKNDAKNVAIAQSIIKHINEVQDLNLDHYLKTIGDVGYQIYLVDDEKIHKFYGGNYRVRDLPDSTVQKVLNGKIYHGMRDFPRETFVTGFFANYLSNTVGVPFQYHQKHYAMFLRPDIKLLFNEVHTIMGGWTLFMGIISLAAMLFFAKLLIRPITELTAATKRIARERFDTPLKIERKDEIGQLATSFNTMMGQLQENDLMRKEFISNVSHDFQSPLLNIQGYAGLLKSELTEEERHNYVAIIQNETHRLSTLTKQLLLLTSLDQAARRIERKEYSLDQQLKITIQKYRWWLEEEGINLSMTLEPTIFNGDAGLLENVWENLLTNAIKYNRSDGDIYVTLASSMKEVNVIIQDTGIGMNDVTKKQLFERFYRADESRSKEGTGLGLSIVEEIIHLHEGHIKVESELNKGTTFIISLPNL